MTTLRVEETRSEFSEVYATFEVMMQFEKWPGRFAREATRKMSVPHQTASPNFE